MKAQLLAQLLDILETAQEWEIYLTRVHNNEDPGISEVDLIDFGGFIERIQLAYDAVKLEET